MNPSHAPGEWLPQPAEFRPENAVPWTDPNAPYVSSYAFRYHRDEACTGVDVIKVQYAIDLEKRLRALASYATEQVIRVRDLQLKIGEREKQIADLKAAGTALGIDVTRPGWKERWAAWMRSKEEA